MDIKLEAIKDFYKEVYERVIKSEYYDLDKKGYVCEVIEDIFRPDEVPTIEKTLEKYSFLRFLNKERLLSGFTGKGFYINEEVAGFLRSQKSAKTDELEKAKRGDQKFVDYVRDVILLDWLEGYVSKKLNKKILIEKDKVRFEDII